MEFWKMHGLGNDYVVIDNRSGCLGEEEAGSLARRLCQRRFSVGADGLLLIYGSDKADVKMRIFNADGSEAEMCGNGIRCLAKYCYENNIARKEVLKVETLAGVKTVWLTVEGGEVRKVKVDMGKPLLERSAIPMVGEGRCIDEVLKVDGEDLHVTCLSVGNPHCVTFVEDVEAFPVCEVGPKVENHPSFPHRINAEFVQVMSRGELRIRVWERGCGETLACGTGACASVVAGNLLQKVSGKVIVHLSGGDLEIEYLGNVWMTGAAEKVYVGRLF